MHTGLLLTAICSMLIPAASNAGAVFQVGEIVDLSNSDHFVCRISDYEYSQVARFRVYWKDFSVDPGNAEARAFITECLENASRIELYDVQFQNYFRVKAKIRVDGQPLKELCASRDLVLPESAETVQSKRPEPVRAKRVPWQSGPLKSLENPVPVRHNHLRRAVPRTVRIKDLMERTVDCSALTADTTLSEALEMLSASVDPPLPLVTFWGDLEANALIDKDMPIGIEGMRQMKVKDALRIILQAISVRGASLGIVESGGILTLATQQTLQKRKTTRIYSVEDLLAPPSTVYTNRRQTTGTSNGRRTPGNSNGRRDLGNVINNHTRSR